MLVEEIHIAEELDLIIDMGVCMTKSLMNLYLPLIADSSPCLLSLIRPVKWATTGGKDRFALQCHAQFNENGHAPKGAAAVSH